MKPLRRSDAAYRVLLEDEEVAVFVVAQVIEDCNEVACRMLGVSRDALLGRMLFEFSPPVQPDGTASTEGARRRTESALAGLPQWFEWQFRRADGELVATSIHLEAMRVDAAECMAARVKNLSRLWRAEASLRESELRLQQILDNSNAIVFAKDKAGRYLFVNRELGRLLGPAQDKLVGATDYDLFPADVADRLRRIDRRVFERRRSIQYEETFTLGGAERTYLTHKFPLLRSDGEPYAVCGIAADITDRKRTEEALRQAAVALSGAEGAEVFEGLVRSLAEIVKADAALIAVSAGGGRMRTVALCLDGQIVPNVEYEMAKTPCAYVVGREYRFFPSGIRRQYPGDGMLGSLGIDSYAGYPLSDAAGRPLGLVIAMSRKPLENAPLVESMLKIFAVRAAAEIERSRAEAALRASEASYRSIFEAAEDAIFIHDYDTGAIVDVNPKACAAYGYTYDEMKRLSVADISSGEHPHTMEEAGKLMAEAKQGKPLRFEWHRRNKDGSLHWDEVYLKQAVIAGEPRILAFTREITERKLAEQRLRASEEQYRAIFNASADALVLWNSRYQRVDVNPAYERMYGYSRDEVLGGARARDVPAEHRRRQMEIISRTLAGDRCHEEIETVRRTGERFPIEVRTIPILHRGEPHVLAMIRDLTERRRVEQDRAQLEAQLRQAQKMEAIGHLTGGIAHDFNNILTSIMGYIVLALERQEGLGDKKLAQFLEQANLSCQRARDLIQQMLIFSRGRKGERRQVSLANVVSESTTLLRSSMPATLELIIELNRDIPPAMLDPVQAEQVLLNLCINARDATQGNGFVRVSVRHMAIEGAVCASCREPVRGEFVGLGVRDNGTGIAPEVMERMFEPFYSTKEVGKGSGMGLSTVHGIVHEHGGHVLVTSERGKGATFHVLFPTASRAGTGASNESGSAAVARTPRPALAGHLLVVDDEEMVGEFMRDLLESWGLKVTLTSNAVDAKEIFARDPQRFDAVITDQTMPRLTGLALARELLAIRETVLVIIYTGYSEGLTEAEVKAIGARALLRKPVEQGALLALLKENLGEEVKK